MSNNITDKEQINEEAQITETSDILLHEEANNTATANNRNKLLPWIITGAVAALLAIGGLAWIATRQADGETKAESSSETEKKEEPGHSENTEEGEEVRLDPETLKSAGIEIEGVTQRPAIAKLYVTGSVELNPERTEMATPLVGGRIERVFAAVGDYVEKGMLLAYISSPQMAQLHGKMHEARTRYELAQRNLERVQKSENRVTVLAAKAKLDEADATLTRTKKLIELGAGAGKDLIAAEAAYKTAKADYEFQTNISLNKEIQEAKASVETTRVDLHHIQDEMRSLGVSVDIDRLDNHDRNTSLVAIKSPLSGIVTERRFNSGAGIDAAVPVFVISNTSTVYVVANVPEINLNKLQIGSVAEVRSLAFGTITGRISYIDPKLDETTRTARVRLDVPNLDGKLKGGMFTEVGFYTGTSAEGGQELVVRTDAIQREGDKTIVFIPKENDPGAFEVRQIEVNGEYEGYTAVKNGLEIGEKVVTKGSFAIKTQMAKGEMGDHH